MCPTAKIVTISRLAQNATRLDIAWWEGKPHPQNDNRSHAEEVLHEQMFEQASAMKYAVQALRENTYVETILSELHEAIALMLNQHAWSTTDYEGYTEHQQKTAGLAIAFAKAMSIHHIVNNETEACEGCNHLEPMTNDQNKTFMDLLTTLNPPNTQAP